jgi:hypothetical protein
MRLNRLPDLRAVQTFVLGKRYGQIRRVDQLTTLQFGQPIDR